MLRFFISLFVAISLFQTGFSLAETIETGSGVVVGGTSPKNVVKEPATDQSDDHTATDGKTKEKELPKSGLLATVVNTNATRGLATKSQWGVDNLFEESSDAPVGASVKKVGKDWDVTLRNNSKSDSYSIKVDIVQGDKNGGVLSKKRVSYTLPAGASKLVKVTGSTKTEVVNVELVNQKKLGK